MNSESDTESEELQDFAHRSEVYTFASRKPKANSPLHHRNPVCDEISAFTQATQGTKKTYET